GRVGTAASCSRYRPPPEHHEQTLLVRIQGGGNRSRTANPPANRDRGQDGPQHQPYRRPQTRARHSQSSLDASPHSAGVWNSGSENNAIENATITVFAACESSVACPHSEAVHVRRRSPMGLEIVRARTRGENSRAGLFLWHRRNRIS